MGTLEVVLLSFSRASRMPWQPRDGSGSLSHAPRNCLHRKLSLRGFCLLGVQMREYGPTDPNQIKSNTPQLSCHVKASRGSFLVVAVAFYALSAAENVSSSSTRPGVGRASRKSTNRTCCGGEPADDAPITAQRSHWVGRPQKWRAAMRYCLTCAGYIEHIRAAR